MNADPNGERCIHCGDDMGECGCSPKDRPIYAQNRWTVRGNGLHYTILEDSGGDLTYVGEFREERIAKRIAEDHNNRLDASAKKTHDAMLWIGYWLCLGKYRTLMRRHNGCYRATDQGVDPPQEWNADTLCQLVGLMRGELEEELEA